MLTTMVCFYLDEALKRQTGRIESFLASGKLFMKAYRNCQGMCKRVGLHVITFFRTLHFLRYLPHIYNKQNNIKKLLDIGGNTGKWAIASTKYNPDISITIMDLPGQLNVAKNKFLNFDYQIVFRFIQQNILDASQPFPKGFDAIWMSQFLDCFSEEEITSIMQRCYDAIDDNGFVYILEAYWDKQRFEAAAFGLQQTSVYFTALANGNSQMYHSEIFKAAVLNAGFEIVEETDNIV
jgi:SAM-dependent methyltransferase